MLAVTAETESVEAEVEPEAEAKLVYAAFCKADDEATTVAEPEFTSAG